MLRFVFGSVFCVLIFSACSPIKNDRADLKSDPVVISQGGSGNLFLNKSVIASRTHPTTALANVTDGNLGSVWNSGDYAPQWVEIRSLEGVAPITKLRLIPEQSPNGKTEHIISAKGQNGVWRRVASINKVTENGQPIEVSFGDPLSGLLSIKVETIKSPSWIAWREIQAFSASDVFNELSKKRGQEGRGGASGVKKVRCEIKSISDGVRSYVGECQKNIPDGVGVMSWYSGDVYEGDFVQGKRTGKGVFLNNSGDRYEGDFVDGKFSGRGVYLSSNGDRYQGGWRDGNKEGFGSLKMSNGGHYEGEWLAGAEHGFGSMVIPEGYVLHESGSEIGKIGGHIIGLWRNGKVYKRFYNCDSKKNCLDKEAREQAEEKARRQKWEAELNAKDPQQMYLNAGRYLRDGYSSKAKQLYEAIQNRFPSSSFAVKASDQLSSMKREEQLEANRRAEQEYAESQRRQQRERESLSCMTRQSSCRETCRGLYGRPWSNCQDRCRSIC